MEIDEKRKTYLNAKPSVNIGTIGILEQVRSINVPCEKRDHPSFDRRSVVRPGCCSRGHGVGVVVVDAVVADYYSLGIVDVGCCNGCSTYHLVSKWKAAPIVGKEGVVRHHLLTSLKVHLVRQHGECWKGND